MQWVFLKEDRYSDEIEENEIKRGFGGLFRSRARYLIRKLEFIDFIQWWIETKDHLWKNSCFSFSIWKEAVSSEATSI